MIDLTKQEKIILLFLVATFLIGLSVSAYKKSQKNLELSVCPAKIATWQKADRLIEQNRLVNINSQKIEDLIRLPGIGEKIAQRIIAYRQTHGPFMTKEELMQVEGIGEHKFEQIKGLLTLE